VRGPSGPGSLFQGSHEGIWDIQLMVFDTATTSTAFLVWSSHVGVLGYLAHGVHFCFSLFLLTFASVGAYMDCSLTLFFCLIFSLVP
jgi:hypothetical protein